MTYGEVHLGAHLSPESSFWGFQVLKLQASMRSVVVPFYKLFK